MKLKTSIREAMADMILDAIDDSGQSTLQIYTGEEPATMGETITDTLLGTINLPFAFGTQTGGVLTMGTVTHTPDAVATGVAGWGRIRDAAGTEILYGSCSIPGGGGTFILNTVQVAIDGPIIVRSGVIAIGGG